jgi:hypothetical protein
MANKKLALQNRVILYGQPSGPGTGLEPLSIRNHGRGDTTDDTIPGQSELFGRDEFGRPVIKVTFPETPGGGVSFQVDADALAELGVLDSRREDLGKFNLYEFYIPIGPISNYTNWTNKGYMIAFVGCRITGQTFGGHSKDFSGNPISDSYQIEAEYALKALPPSLSAGTTAETEDLDYIAGLTVLDPENEIEGYLGPDKHLFLIADAGSGVTPNVQYSTDGGASWATFGADPLGADEFPAGLVVDFISPTQYRLVTLRLTADASNPPEINYADITLGNEAASPTWSVVELGATNNEAGECLAWPLFGRMYAGVAGDVFVSTNQGVTWTEVYTGSVALAAFAIDPLTEDVWAVGASNLILREQENNRGTFTARTGPSGGGAFTAIAIASDGTLYAGNGTSIYKSTSLASGTASWTALKNFGSNHVVKGIHCIRDNSQFLKILVSDTSGNEGDVWYSLDGGNTFTEITNLTNSGYNAWYVSDQNPWTAVIVGEDNGATGVVHLLTA